ncbi:hypothetical protein ACR6A7_19730 [Pantoea sp. RRHST58]|uniref:hypothetical protein n=1 Tax=Pantoea sp. RRHST58 TaxID=3425183 RepID=UPI003DA01419
MAKMTQLIPAPSHSEQARQLMLAIITLAEKQAAAPEGYENRLHAISMLAHEAYDTIIDADLFSSDQGDRELLHPDC